MAKHVYIEDIASSKGQTVTLRGWVYNKSSKGKLHFLQLRDGTGILQCVLFKNDVPPELFETVGHLSQETAVEVTGEVREDKRSAAGYEIGVKDLSVVAEPTEEYPITPKEHGVAFLMERRHLWLRSRRQWAILRIRATIASAIREFFDQRGFTLIDAPIFTPNACEGTTTLFETPYFDQTAYLTQSGQLYMEAAAMALGKVYCFGPAFRAEKSKTRRHLTEFWMVEPEVAYLELDGDMELAEEFICFLIEKVLQKRKIELEVLERDISFLQKIQKPFPRVSYEEAIAKLKELGSDISYGDDFGGDDETILTKEYDCPILVHRFPAAIKAFYMKQDPQNPKLALGFDMLAPEGYGEIIGGGERENDLQTLLDGIDAHQLPKEAFEWYLDLRRYGSVPHAGFGLGLERTVAWLCGIPHVRETSAFPRMLERLTP